MITSRNYKNTLSVPPKPRLGASEEKYKRGRGPGSTASGVPSGTPPSINPPPSNIKFF